MSNPPPIPPKPMVYVTHDGRTWGPYDTASLQKHVNDRKFLPTDLANVVGSDNWQPLNTIASFPVEPQQVVVHQQKEKKKTGCLTWCVLIFFIVLVFGIISSDDIGSAEGKNPVNASIRKSMTTLSITNKDSFTWPSVTIHVNGYLGGYEYEYNERVQSGENIEIRLVNFTKSNGERFQPLKTDVKDVWVHVPGYDLPNYNF
jgi:hypothetical protein